MPNPTKAALNRAAFVFLHSKLKIKQNFLLKGSERIYHLFYFKNE
jgi:hypothetical protein